MPKHEDDDELVNHATPLMSACRLELRDVINALLKSHVPICAVDSTGKTALHYLVDCSDASIADLLLDHDPSILEIGDCEGITALGLAVIHGNERLVRRLAERQTNLGCRDNEGHSLAHLATAYGQLEMLDLLESLGVDFSSADSHGATSVHYAAQLNSDQDAGALRVLQKLLSKKVDVDCRDCTQRTPLLWAASSGRWKACEILLKEGAQLEAFDADGLTALHCAASQGHIRCVEVLLKSGADPNSRDRSECSPLFYAIALNHIECVQSLLHSGADPNHKDIKARSPGHCAATQGSVPMLQTLEMQRGNLWMPNQKGNYPIHDAALSRNTDAVKYLLESSKNCKKIVNLCSVEGQSLLHMAAVTDNLPLLQYLLEQGVYQNPIMKNKGKELTPYDMAMIKKSKTCLECLKLVVAISASDCDERVKAEGNKAREEAQRAVSLEYNDDAALSNTTSCRSHKETDAVEYENKTRVHKGMDAAEDGNKTRAHKGLDAAEDEYKTRMLDAAEDGIKMRAHKGMDAAEDENKARMLDAAEDGIKMRAHKGMDAAEDENKARTKDTGERCYTEDASGCYDLHDDDALKKKAEAIVSNVISRALSVVELEKSENALSTNNAFSTGASSMKRAGKRSRVPPLPPPKKKKNKNVYKQIEYDDHAKTVYNLPLPPVFDLGSRNPRLKDPRTSLSIENAARLKENAKIYGICKARSRNTRGAKMEPKKPDSYRFNSRATFSELTATTGSRDNSPGIIKNCPEQDYEERPFTKGYKNSRRVGLQLRTSESRSTLSKQYEDAVSRSIGSYNSLTTNGNSKTGNLPDRTVGISSDSLNRLPRNGVTPGHDVFLPQMRRANSPRRPRQRTTFCPATNNRDSYATETTSSNRKSNDGRKPSDGDIKTKNWKFPSLPKTQRKVLTERSFHPRRKNRNLIQEYVRVFELKRRTTNELHEIKRRQMCGQYFDGGGGEGDQSDRSWIRRLARDYNMNTSIYDSYFDENQFEGIEDFERHMRSELQRALKEEKWLNTLSRTTYEILPRENGRMSEFAASHHLETDAVRRSIRQDYDHHKHVARRPLKSDQQRHLPEIRPMDTSQTH